ncbi:MAG: hypothetical protein Q8O37_00610 [Sulfuricellaceae bacterium]|nr:hypothetical protein [Sulfuricellaceae bacterium]
MSPQQETPYAAPSAHVSDHVSQEEGFLCDPPNLVSSGRGTELLADIAKDLPRIACFNNQDPLVLQRALRDEWN